jgi:K+/H+ antiporter YhaU regulatory subunit KhtT
MLYFLKDFFVEGMSPVSEKAPCSRSARYIKIAVDIAACIARGEYREKQKILGRSSLAGRYNVSPETIRRALAVLEEKKIVKLLPGIGVIVTSHHAAEDYLAEYGQHQILEDIQKGLHFYLEERRKLDLKIVQLTDELLEYTFKMATRLQRIHEFRVESESPLVGKSLKEANFRTRTGGTILSINRSGSDIVSPNADTVIKKNDILTVVAPEEAVEHSQSLKLALLSGPTRKKMENPEQII